MLICENVATEENGGHDTGAEITGQVGGDGDVGKAPDHVCVGQTDNERDAGGGDEGVRRIETWELLTVTLNAMALKLGGVLTSPDDNSLSMKHISSGPNHYSVCIYGGSRCSYRRRILS